MNTYYYSGTSDEIETILHDGFVDYIEERNTGRLGVYVGDAPGEPDPDFPDDQVLEITLPEQIDTSNWPRKRYYASQIRRLGGGN